MSQKQIQDLKYQLNAAKNGHRKVRDDNLKLQSIKMTKKNEEGGMRRTMVSIYKGKSMEGGS